MEDTGEAKLERIPLCTPRMDEAWSRRVGEQVASGWIGPGPTTRDLAEGLAREAGVSQCLLTVSGTVALSLAALALGLGRGDQVAIPAYGVAATANAFAVLGLDLLLIDIERHSGCMDPIQLRQRLRPETKAVCFVNFSGYTGPALATVADLCREKGLPLVEDAAAALGHSFQGRSAGSWGDVGIYSFSVPKILTTGQGGALLTSRPEVLTAAAAFADHGGGDWRRTNLHVRLGSNLRFNDILASLGLTQLKALPQLQERRRVVYGILKGALGDRLFSVPGDQAPLHNIVFTPDADAMVETLNKCGVGAVCQYRTISQHPIYGRWRRHDTPNADYWTDHAVYLPFGNGLTPKHAQRILQALDQASLELWPCQG